MSLLTEFLPQACVAPLNVDQYHAMIRNGILPEGESLELIDGLLIRKDRRDHSGDIMTVGPRHAEAVGSLGDLLHDLLKPMPVHVRSQMPITLDEIREPEPDLAVVQGSRRDYSREHPRPENVNLVVEVANSSLAFDRTSKLRMYAAAGIPEYWIINLTSGLIEVYRSPDSIGETYTQQTEIRSGETITFELCGQPFSLQASEVLI